MTEVDVCRMYEESLEAAKQCLRELPIYCGSDPSFTGLSGWVFEQTVQTCVRRDLDDLGSNLLVREHVSLGGRRSADLGVGSVAIELKTAGLFGQRDIAKYTDYRSRARELGLRFVFLSRRETHAPYRTGITQALDAENVFFLDETGSWERFMNLLARVAGTQHAHPDGLRASGNVDSRGSGARRR